MTPLEQDLTSPRHHRIPHVLINEVEEHGASEGDYGPPPEIPLRSPLRLASRIPALLDGVPNTEEGEIVYGPHQRSSKESPRRRIKDDGDDLPSDQSSSISSFNRTSCSSSSKEERTERAGDAVDEDETPTDNYAVNISNFPSPPSARSSEKPLPQTPSPPVLPTRNRSDGTSTPRPLGRSLTAFRSGHGPGESSGSRFRLATEEIVRGHGFDSRFDPMKSPGLPLPNPLASPYTSPVSTRPSLSNSPPLKSTVLDRSRTVRRNETTKSNEARSPPTLISRSSDQWDGRSSCNRHPSQTTRSRQRGGQGHNTSIDMDQYNSTSQTRQAGNNEQTIQQYRVDISSRPNMSRYEGPEFESNRGPNTIFEDVFDSENVSPLHSWSQAGEQTVQSSHPGMLSLAPGDSISQAVGRGNLLQQVVGIGPAPTERPDQYVKEQFLKSARRANEYYQERLRDIHDDLNMSEQEKQRARAAEHRILVQKFARYAEDTCYDQIDEKWTDLPEIQVMHGRNSIEDLVFQGQSPQQPPRSGYKRAAIKIGRCIRWLLAVPDDPDLKTFSRRKLFDSRLGTEEVSVTNRSSSDVRRNPTITRREARRLERIVSESAAHSASESSQEAHSQSTGKESVISGWKAKNVGAVFESKDEKDNREQEMVPKVKLRSSPTEAVTQRQGVPTPRPNVMPTSMLHSRSNHRIQAHKYLGRDVKARRSEGTMMPSLYQAGNYRYDFEEQSSRSKRHQQAIESPVTQGTELAKWGQPDAYSDVSSATDNTLWPTISQTGDRMYAQPRLQRPGKDASARFAGAVRRGANAQTDDRSLPAISGMAGPTLGGNTRLRAARPSIKISRRPQRTDDHSDVQSNVTEGTMLPTQSVMGDLRYY